MIFRAPSHSSRTMDVNFTFEYSGFCAIESRLSSAAGHCTHFVVQKSVELK